MLCDPYEIKNGMTSFNEISDEIQINPTVIIIITILNLVAIGTLFQRV